MTGQTLTVTLAAMFGVGLCAGLLIGPLFDWYYSRKYAKRHAQWEKLHAPVTETEFLYLVDDERIS